MNTALIFGAGKTGRGFAAHLAHLGGYEILLIDKNQQLVHALNEAGQYQIEVLDNKEKSCSIPIKRAYHVDDVSWYPQLVYTPVVFTAVFGNHLPALAATLAPALVQRHKENEEQSLTIITCENLAGAAALLKEKIQAVIPDQNNWLQQQVGFSEGIIFRTCLDPSATQPPLTIRTQDFFELPCDADEVKEPLHIFGLKPMKHFANQLRRKIFTYNCINAVIAYLGARKGYQQLYEAGNDEEILEVARKAAGETAAALVAEFGFDKQEQEQWSAAALKKFADKNIPDPIERNAADPARKLAREDRLIGPALLALKHGISPKGLVEGILACIDYRDPRTGFSIADEAQERGSGFVLTAYGGLSANEPLYTLLLNKMQSRRLHGQ